MPVREKPRPKRRSDDEFVVFLQGIPSHCRWQELKDLVRQTALHIRQAVVYDDSHGFPTGLGQIIVKNEDEAWKTYHRLSTNGWDGQSLIVTLARTSTPTKPIAGPTRSPMHYSGHCTPPHRNLKFPPSPVLPESTHTSPTFSYPEYGGMMPTMPMTPYMPMMPELIPMQFPPSPVTGGYEPPYWSMPGYPMSPDQGSFDSYRYHRSPPTPESHAHTGYRGIILENLNPSTKGADLESLLHTAGAVEQIRVTNDQGQAQGLITMRTAEEAQRAISMFNNIVFMNSRVYARFDRRDSLDSSDADSEFGRESWNGSFTPVKSRADTCSPLVVDGSGLASRFEMLSTSAPT
ncbi:Nucleotide-binding alpha-beta plait [Penicillium nucicola]|uniref:Nucleotide-binding alpha-beta plait n=1 Tax=Penicillium nucicola TaxID=1850975 RepID=UPI00254563FB|nr:Nucleotide-binding alpha-beta plait [Penicillium nucicola]KAJ5769801.1 Nucleotide-binding alpha-beta plait [Penicillium nucicola]